MDIIDWLREFRLRRMEKWNEKMRRSLDLKEIELAGELEYKEVLTSNILAESKLEKAKAIREGGAK